MIESRETEERLLTRAEVAKIFHVSPSTITRWAEAGKLPVVKTLGGHRRYAENTVMELAQQFTSTLSMSADINLNEEVRMKKALIKVPAMYGDHHVLEVRRILLAAPGVEDINASSCFQTVEVVLDPTKTDADEIAAKLREAGYLEDLPVPVETGVAASQNPNGDQKTFFRHTTAFEETKNIVGFAQPMQANYAGRPLWPCPGVGVIDSAELEEAPHG